MTSMRALHLLEKRVSLTHTHPRPVPTPEEALIRISLASICATDLHIIQGYKNFQGVLGHEFVGVVVSARDPDWVGVRVVGEINCGCGDCQTCRQGLPAHCPQRTVPGLLGRDGVFAEYCTLPLKNLHPVPTTMRDQTAVFVEPLAAALEILQQVHMRPHDRVALIGDGRLGLLVAQVLALSGCKLLVVGRHPEKWSVLENQGIHVCREAEIPRGFKADTVVECSGRAEGFQLARHVLKPRGTLVLKSTFHGTTPVDLTGLVVEEITVIGSRCGPFPPAIRLLERAHIQTDPLITATHPLEHGIQALAQAGHKGALKILLKP